MQSSRRKETRLIGHKLNKSMDINFSSLGYRQWDSAFNEVIYWVMLWKMMSGLLNNKKTMLLLNLGTSIENDVIMSRTAGATGDFATFATTLDAN